MVKATSIILSAVLYFKFVKCNIIVKNYEADAAGAETRQVQGTINIAERPSLQNYI